MQQKRFNYGARRAALYIRVSSEEQAMHGLSLDAQEETLIKYAESNHLDIIEIFRDEGATARKKYTKRKEFMRMLSFVEQDRIDIILFIKLDRWFRNVADYYEVQHILDAHNVHWIATEEDYDTATANGRLHLNIKLSIAQDEADRTSERIKFVFEGKKARGEVVSGKVPYGYKIVEKRLAIAPEEAKFALEVFEKYEACRSVTATHRYINEKYSSTWSYQQIRNILSNRIYMGELHGVSGSCPSIIEPNRFMHIQEWMKERAERNSRTPKHTYLFVGLLVCAECGRRLCGHIMGSAKHPQRYIYYRCCLSDSKRCTHRHHTSELVLEKWLLNNLIAACEKANFELEQKKGDQKKKVDTSKITNKLTRLKELYLAELIDIDTYRKDYEELTAQLREANKTEPLPDKVNISEIKTALEHYKLLNKKEKKEFWSRTVDHITVTNDDNFFVTPIFP